MVTLARMHPGTWHARQLGPMSVPLATRQVEHWGPSLKKSGAGGQGSTGGGPPYPLCHKQCSAKGREGLPPAPWWAAPRGPRPSTAAPARGSPAACPWGRLAAGCARSRPSAAGRGPGLANRREPRRQTAPTLCKGGGGGRQGSKEGEAGPDHICRQPGGVQGPRTIGHEQLPHCARGVGGGVLLYGTAGTSRHFWATGACAADSCTGWSCELVSRPR